jgi:benzoate/toluate 1,2-dioxygenase reductase component
VSYQIALNFEDGVTRFVDCNVGESVLDAAYRAQVNLPMDCSDGVCGTCKCRAEAGDFDLGEDFIDEALTEDEMAEGMVLTCQMVPLSDCIIAVPVASSALNLKPARHSARVHEVRLVSATAIVLALELDDIAAIAFLPGQYVNIDVPGAGVHRAYSFSSAPGSTVASFLIRNIPGGKMSDWLTGQAKAGNEVSFVGPYGSFYLRPVERPLLLLAGGTGLAPLLSMLEVLADHGVGHALHLLYGVTTDNDLVELDRIDALAQRLPSLTWDVCVADTGSAQPLKGFVTQHIQESHLNGGDVDVYLCGPPPMVEAVRSFLKDKNIAPRNFFFEKFNPSESA